jgi:hypothetical protein
MQGGTDMFPFPEVSLNTSLNMLPALFYPLGKAISVETISHPKPKTVLRRKYSLELYTKPVNLM